MADDRESNLTNLYSTTLSSSVGPTDLTFPVESLVGAPASPCFIFIRSTDGSQFEIIDADGVFTGGAFVATAIGKRYLTGSSAASGLTHAEGSIVEVRPVAQYWQQVHDRIDAVGASGAGAVAQSLYDANTILKADADNTPEALVVAEDRLVGRLAGGEITGLTPAQVVDTLLAGELSGTCLAKAGGTMTGDLVLAGDPDQPLEAATKQYVDNAAPAQDMELIGETVLGSDGSVTISSIPATFRHLRLVIVGRSAKAAVLDEVAIRLNGDTGANYDRMSSLASGSTITGSQSIGTTSARVGSFPAAAQPAGFATSATIDIPGYDGSLHKSIIAHAACKIAESSGNIYLQSHGTHWRNTAAVTSITVLGETGNLLAGFVVSLYGLKGA